MDVKTINAAADAAEATKDHPIIPAPEKKFLALKFSCGRPDN